MATKELILESLKSCIDPELRMDIVTLGLIYTIDIDQEGNVGIEMTFTSPMCPYGPQLLDDIRGKVIALSGVKTVDVKVTFEPPWKPSEEVMATLGF